MAVTIRGGKPDEWVWSAIAAGDVAAVRAAPASFDTCSVHLRYGNALTAFLAGLLNLEGRFILDSHCRGRRAKELVEELGRRGARPDLVIPGANFEIKGLYRDWRIAGDVTAMQVVIQMRNDLLNFRYESCKEEGDKDGVDSDAAILTELIDKYAELAAQGCRSAPRSLIPDAVVDVWEQCLQHQASADVELVAPDGRASCHSLLLSRASPVVAAMLGSGMAEGRSGEVSLQEPLRVAKLFLALLYTGCLPQDEEGPAQGPALEVGLRVVVRSAFVSNSARNVLLSAGTEGEVQQLDEHGDALVKFDGIRVRQWVKSENQGRLGPAGAEGGCRLQEDLASALGLAHRWQAAGLAAVLADRLERELSFRGFEPVLEAAVLHGVARLQAACLAFAQNSAQVRSAYEAGKFSPAIRTALEPIYGGGPRKRSREAL